MKNLKLKKEVLPTAGYFDYLPEAMRTLIRDLMGETIDDVEGYESTDETFSDIECESRDGFIRAGDNFGGLTSRQFTYLNAMRGSGKRVSHKAAQAEIDRQIEYGLKNAREGFYNEWMSDLTALGIESSESEKCSYHELCEMGEDKLAEALSEYENDSLNSDDCSIMFEVRFLYHSHENGVHRASVSCAVNTEGPYHRSHIAWAPNVFCEGSKEVEITWRNLGGLERKLKAALKKLSSEVF